MVASYNWNGDEEAVRDFLTTPRTTKWNFSGGPVEHEGLTEEEFIINLVKNMRQYSKYYRQYSGSPEIDYNALRSVRENAITPCENFAKNCNAFAYSLLAYSDATYAPDLVTPERSMPGAYTVLDPRVFCEWAPTCRIPSRLKLVKNVPASAKERWERNKQMQIERVLYIMNTSLLGQSL